MFEYFCKICGCSLDPGEGQICDDCREEMSYENRRRKELDRLIRCEDYEQMKMEDFLK